MQNSRLKIGENGLTQRREAANRVLAHGQSFRTGSPSGRAQGLHPGQFKIEKNAGGRSSQVQVAPPIDDPTVRTGHTPACLGGRWPLLCPVNAAA
jgi:hypothetical protein